MGYLNDDAQLTARVTRILQATWNAMMTYGHAKDAAISLCKTQR